MSEESQYPPISEQAKNAAGSAFKIVKGIFNGQPIFATRSKRRKKKNM